LGRGAYGEVWLARNALGAFHAAKIVYRKDFEDSRLSPLRCFLEA
jgi:hypothetical protein